MDAVFESLLFLGIGLLGITVAVFVLAVSLLGRAIRSSIDDAKTTEEARKKETSERIQEIETLIHGSTVETAQLDEAHKRLRALEKVRARHARSLRWIHMKPWFLRASGGVYAPSAFFAASIVFSAYGWYESNRLASGNYMGLLVVGVVFLLVGVVWLGFVLKVIEGVAVTSEDVAYTREKDMFVAALAAYDESKRPELSFEWREPPPFEIEADSMYSLRFTAQVLKSDSCENVIATFYLPPGFSFPGRERLTQPAGDGDIAGYETGSVEFGKPLLQSTKWVNDIAIKAPAEAGTFKGYWGLAGRAAESKMDSFDIQVVQARSPAEAQSKAS